MSLPVHFPAVTRRRRAGRALSAPRGTLSAGLPYRVAPHPGALRPRGRGEPFAIHLTAMTTIHTVGHSRHTAETSTSSIQLGHVIGMGTPIGFELLQGEGPMTKFTRCSAKVAGSAV